ncbi:hypothetical protein Glove_283g105 [Diversispora epigaea]|uniref:Uncharacterized protein n=1 Tax=Diversispora epigaea TaxID=1348612 RepID=A0A397I2S8_9GLOM|nr:hypothetical protein Glove_283g105 [Diversispora epigaea]
MHNKNIIVISIFLIFIVLKGFSNVIPPMDSSDIREISIVLKGFANVIPPMDSSDIREISRTDASEHYIRAEVEEINIRNHNKQHRGYSKWGGYGEGGYDKGEYDKGGYDRKG